MPPVATTIDDPTAAPAAAPAAPAADAGKPGEAVTYEPTGDPGLDLALDFIGKLGIAPTDPAMVAAEAGDFALQKAKLALMGDKAKGWETVTALGEQSFKNLQANRQAETAKTQDAILSVFGEDKAAAATEWAKVRDWAKTNAEPHERAAVNAALAAGGIAAKAMASYLNGLYRKHPSAVIEPTTVTKIGGAASSDSGALSPAQYKEAVNILRGKLGGRLDGSPEYKALQARRMAYRG